MGRQRLLARIEAAFERMEAGRYGKCIACDDRIALSRLQDDPTEAMCAACGEVFPAVEPA